MNTKEYQNLEERIERNPHRMAFMREREKQHNLAQRIINNLRIILLGKSIAQRLLKNMDEKRAAFYGKGDCWQR